VGRAKEYGQSVGARVFGAVALGSDRLHEVAERVIGTIPDAARVEVFMEPLFLASLIVEKSARQTFPDEYDRAAFISSFHDQVTFSVNHLFLNVPIEFDPATKDKIGRLTDLFTEHLQDTREAYARVRKGFILGIYRVLLGEEWFDRLFLTTKLKAIFAHSLAKPPDQLLRDYSEYVCRAFHDIARQPDPPAPADGERNSPPWTPPPLEGRGWSTHVGLKESAVAVLIFGAIVWSFARYGLFAGLVLVAVTLIVLTRGRNAD
jgi:hypothetical protein